MKGKADQQLHTESAVLLLFNHCLLGFLPSSMFEKDQEGVRGPSG